MKKSNAIISILVPLLLLLGVFNKVCGQDEAEKQPRGKIYGDLFVNANYNFGDEFLSFRLNRLHFGYKYNLNDKIYFNGMIESAKENYDPLVDSLGGEYNHITNLFEFCVGFNYDKLQGKFGLIGTEFNQQQEKLWQHRSIDKVFADKYGYAPTNDFGLLLIYNPIDLLTFDVAVTNGEGHKSLAANQYMRYAAGATLSVNDLFVTRVYTDLLSFPGATQTNLIGICGLTSNVVTMGVEWNQQFNSGGLDGYNRNGLSGYAHAPIVEKLQVFGRYDYVTSNKPENLTDNWNLNSDGSLVIAGVQSPVYKGLKLALDYRLWAPADNSIDSKSFLFFDVELAF